MRTRLSRGAPAGKHGPALRGPPPSFAPALLPLYSRVILNLFQDPVLGRGAWHWMLKRVQHDGEREKGKVGPLSRGLLKRHAHYVLHLRAGAELLQRR